MGELEWINVILERRGTAVASELLRLLAAWFVEQSAFRICVDVDPANTTARHFYMKQRAEDLNPTGWSGTTSKSFSANDEQTIPVLRISSCSLFAPERLCRASWIPRYIPLLIVRALLPLSRSIYPYESGMRRFSDSAAARVLVIFGPNPVDHAIGLQPVFWQSISWVFLLCASVPRISPSRLRSFFCIPQADRVHPQQPSLFDNPCVP